MNPAEFANIARAERDFWWYRGMRQILFRLLDPIAGKRRFERVLEAGCGTGHFAQAMASRYGLRMFPVDLGWEGLRHGRRLGVDNLAQADIAALPFPPGSFDLALSLDVIVHFARGEEDRPVEELARVLAAGGLLVLRVSALDALRSRHSEFAHERQRFTRGRLRSLAERHGLEVLRCTYANSLLAPIAFAKFRIWEPLLRAEPRSGVQAVAPWLDRALYKPLEWESRWIGSGRDLPLGQSLILLARKR
jgi:Cyclopropane fatty acid synthase and related methyltransferases